MCVCQRSEFPNFIWQPARLEPLLGALQHQQGRTPGQMEAWGFAVQADSKRGLRQPN